LGLGVGVGIGAGAEAGVALSPSRSLRRPDAVEPIQTQWTGRGYSLLASCYVLAIILTLTVTLTLTLTPALALTLTLASCYVPAVDEAVGAAARDVRHDTAAVAPDAGVVIPKEAGGEHGAVGTLVGVRPGQGSGYKSGQDWG